MSSQAVAGGEAHTLPAVSQALANRRECLRVSLKALGRMQFVLMGFSACFGGTGTKLKS